MRRLSAVGLSMALLLAGCQVEGSPTNAAPTELQTTSGSAEATTSPPVETTMPASVETTSTTSSTTSTTTTSTTTTTAPLPGAPWNAPSLPADAIAEVLIAEWVEDAGAPGTCPMLAFADLGDEADDAVPRHATNVGDMLVAWDRPAGPGHDRDGYPCDDCGRGAIGLGTFLRWAPEASASTHEWADGSFAVMEEGFYGTEVRIQPAGFSCSYWVWSHLGPHHAEYLLTQLRRVEGHP